MCAHVCSHTTHWKMSSFRAMVRACCVKDCKSRSDHDKGLSFLSIPADIQHQGERTKELSARRHIAWIAKINRKDRTPTANSLVCERHFISGKSSELHIREGWAASVTFTGLNILLCCIKACTCRVFVMFVNQFTRCCGCETFQCDVVYIGNHLTSMKTLNQIRLLTQM